MLLLLLLLFAAASCNAGIPPFCPGNATDEAEGGAAYQTAPTPTDVMMAAPDEELKIGYNYASAPGKRP